MLFKQYPRPFENLTGYVYMPKDMVGLVGSHGVIVGQAVVTWTTWGHWCHKAYFLKNYRATDDIQTL